MSKDEIERYSKHLKTGNTAGRDEIPYEFYKKRRPKNIWSV